jgi:hypothetical protein
LFTVKLEKIFPLYISWDTFLQIFRRGRDSAVIKVGTEKNWLCRNPQLLLVLKTWVS